MLTQGKLIESDPVDKDFNDSEGEDVEQGLKYHSLIENQLSDDEDDKDEDANNSEYDGDIGTYEEDIDDQLFGEESVNGVFELFYKFSIFLDSCNHNPDSAKDCKHHVLRVLQAVDDLHDIHSLLHREHICNLFLKAFSKESTPKNYTSLPY